MKGVDVSHLEAGMRVTLVYRRGALLGSDRLSATLTSYNGALWTEGGIPVRTTDGNAGRGVLEVLDPLPPVKLEPLPVGVDPLADISTARLRDALASDETTLDVLIFASRAARHSLELRGIRGEQV